MSDKFYFVASLRGRGFVQGIPIYAFTHGHKSHEWHSTVLRTKRDFDQLAEYISHYRKLTVAVPQVFSLHFAGEDYSRMVIYAYDADDKQPVYMFGRTISTVINDTNVNGKIAMNGWKGLPEPRGAQRRWLEGNVQNWSLPVGVMLNVEQGSVKVVE